MDNNDMQWTMILLALDLGEVLSSCDVSHHVSSPSADILTRNAVGDAVVSCTQPTILVDDGVVTNTQPTIFVDDEVVTNTQPSRDASIEQLSDDGDIEASSDDEVVESQSINAPHPNVFSVIDPQGIQLEVDLSGWFNTSSPQSEVSTSTETECIHSTTDSIVPKNQGHHMVTRHKEKSSPVAHMFLL
ncbi:hypothetical protein HAX54_030884 [Datura stramonium]|uniref:Uncharacterized protein n=1 Tax=Datura stramonium TaxID=4076 RepID=A0ABS8VB83_DATST|nr:hypothetical protein [Datura stramonium]